MFSNIKKNFGFGCMRLPMNEGEVDIAEFTKMVDTFMNAGFNYFDTAHNYIGGKSETALKQALTSRYKREEYILTNKLSTSFFNSNNEILPVFNSQLEACGVDYFDFYLMHAQDKSLYEKYKRCRAYETAIQLKEQGKIKHFGISFHDKAEVLEEILTEYPEIEVVQIQFNYADYLDASVQSKKVYDVCRKHNKAIIVMEPVKGGSLVNLPEEAKAVFNELKGSYASFAIRFAAGFEGIFMVLSGMGNMEMMLDNISYMKDFKPLDSCEMEAVEKVREIFNAQNVIPCTACRYCADCPKKIAIPEMFACLNGKKTHNNWNTAYYYGIHTNNAGKASDCIECGHCESVCPQHLEIIKLLKEVAKEFEK